MSDLTDLKEYRHSINLMLEYYSKQFPGQDMARLVAILSKADVLGLVKFAFDKGVNVGVEQ